ncbi:uncharacterized protein LOC122807607 [Protopterus annectens]|uniref:uncharacterized protein LOC122807607 n=1 Tax=Protopterus annectens TaxID=7888 RepID=UPI001CFBD736|nr:uncharacterized protein LOC122807607 [Protopterus annectens]
MTTLTGEETGGMEGRGETDSNEGSSIVTFNELSLHCVNLSNLTLNYEMLNVLYKGSKFVPTFFPSLADIYFEVKCFIRKLLLRVYFFRREKLNTSIPTVNEESSDSEIDEDLCNLSIYNYELEPDIIDNNSDVPTVENVENVNFLTGYGNYEVSSINEVNIGYHKIDLFLEELLLDERIDSDMYNYLKDENPIISTIVEKLNSYVILKVKNARNTTAARQGCEPCWEQDYMLELDDLLYDLVVEVWNKGLIRDAFLGAVSIPLTEVDYATEEGTGTWWALYTDTIQNENDVSSTEDLAPHEILLDLFFVLSDGIPLDEAYLLLQKLKGSKTDYQDQENFEIQCSPRLPSEDSQFHKNYKQYDDQNSGCRTDHNGTSLQKSSCNQVRHPHISSKGFPVNQDAEGNLREEEIVCRSSIAKARWANAIQKVKLLF